MTEKRARKTRSDKGTFQVTERDIQLLKYMSEMYAVRVDHFKELTLRISHRDKISNSRIEFNIQRMSKAGWVVCKKILHGKPRYLWATKKGMKISGADYPYREPAIARLQHIDAVNKSRLWIEKRAKDSGQNVTWFSDRVINLERKDEGKSHLVDGEIILQGRKIAIEVELTRKRLARLRSILNELKDDYESIRYFCSSDCYNTVKKLTDERNQTAGKNKFVVYLLDDLKID